MNRAYKPLIIFACVAVTAMCTLPIMSTYLSDGESCTLMVRGYNLMEFSALAIIPMIAPLFIGVILFGFQSKAAQEIELLILTVVNMIGYVHGVNAAKEWLHSVDGSLLKYYPGMILLPFVFILLIFSAFVVIRDNADNSLITTENTLYNNEEHDYE